jgi:hypothetical protein
MVRENFMVREKVHDQRKSWWLEKKVIIREKDHDQRKSLWSDKNFVIREKGHGQRKICYLRKSPQSEKKFMIRELLSEKKFMIRELLSEKKFMIRELLSEKKFMIRENSWSEKSSWSGKRFMIREKGSWSEKKFMIREKVHDQRKSSWSEKKAHDQRKSSWSEKKNHDQRKSAWSDQRKSTWLEKKAHDQRKSSWSAKKLMFRKNFFYLIYYEIRYLTAITFDMTRITIQANNTNTNPVWSIMLHGGSLPQISNYLLLLLLSHLANAALKVLFSLSIICWYSSSLSSSFSFGKGGSSFFSPSSSSTSPSGSLYKYIQMHPLKYKKKFSTWLSQRQGLDVLIELKRCVQLENGDVVGDHVTVVRLVHPHGRNLRDIQRIYFLKSGLFSVVFGLLLILRGESNYLPLFALHKLHGQSPIGHWPCPLHNDDGEVIVPLFLSNRSTVKDQLLIN